MVRAARSTRLIALVAGLACGALPAAAQHPLRLRFYDAGGWGYVDSTGRVVIPPQFVNALDYFSEGFARVQIGRESRSAKWTYVQTSGRILGAARFDDAGDFAEGLAPVAVGGKWGVIDTSGAFVVEPRYGKPIHFSANRAAVPIDGKFGYIDPRGTVVIPARFDEAYGFRGGVATVKVGTKWGLIDTAGREVLEPRYDLVFVMSPERYAVRLEQQWRLLNRGGQIIGPPLESIDYQGFSEGLATLRRGEKLGYIDTSGALVIPVEFDIAEPFSSGRARVRKIAWFRESPSQPWGFIDRRGTVVARFRDAQPFTEGLAAVAIGGRWGYVDTTGTVAIAAQFSEARPFSNGAANVTFPDQSWGYIDRAGRVIWRSAPGPARPTVAATAESTDTSGLAGSGPLVARLGRFVQRLETAEQHGQLGVVAFGATPLLPAIVGADRRARAYADSHPDDARLAVLVARLGRLKWVAEPVVFSAENQPSLDAFMAAFSPYQAYLGRALALAPNDAEAHYWMGRLYAVRFGWKRFLYGSDAPDTTAAFFRTSLDSALHHGRRAVELAAAQVAAREALALYLVMAERPDEAADAVRDVAGGRHPIYLLITDWRMVPAPPGAVPDPQQTQMLASMQQQLGQSYPDLRVRAYVVPLPAAEVEAFYRARWPTLRLFEETDEDMREAGGRVFMQFLRTRERGQNTTLEPARAKRDLDRLSDVAQLPDGFMVGLIEMTKPPDEVRAKLPMAVGDVFCILTVVNMRRVP